MNPILVLTTLSLLQSAPATDAGTLVDRHLAWLGGAEAVAALRTLHLEGTVAAAGLRGPITVDARRDGHLIREYDLQVVSGVEIVTPDSGWSVNPNGQVEPLGDYRELSERRALARVFGGHLLGTTDAVATRAEPVDRDGVRWEVVRFTYPGGDFYELLLDPDGSCGGARQAEDTDTTWVRFDDWRPVDGVRFPHHMEQLETGDPTGAVTMVWEVVQAAIDLPDSRFLPPDPGNDVATLGEAATTTGWIPFDLYLEGYIYMPGAIDGSEADVLLDSGAGMTVLDSTFAAEAGIATFGSFRARGSGGSQTASMATGLTLTFGGLELPGITAAVIDFSEIASRIGRDLDVVLGKEIFNAMLVDIDYPGRRIAFHDPESHPYDGPGSKLDLFPAGEGQMQAELAIGDLPPARFDLDTGNGSSPLVVFQHYHEENGILNGLSPVSSHLGGGVGGTRVDDVAVLPSVTLAGHELRNVPTVFTREVAGSFDTRRFAGNLGTGILSRFRVVFDYPGQRMFLEPGPGWDDRPFPRNRAGITVAPGEGGLEVLHVAPGSPAEADGWQVGDLVTAVDGEPATVARFRAAVLGAEGTRLALEDGSGTGRVLVLADYY